MSILGELMAAGAVGLTLREIVARCEIDPVPALAEINVLVDRGIVRGYNETMGGYERQGTVVRWYFTQDMEE